MKGQPVHRRQEIESFFEGSSFVTIIVRSASIGTNATHKTRNVFDGPEFPPVEIRGNFSFANSSEPPSRW